MNSKIDKMLEGYESVSKHIMAKMNTDFNKLRESGLEMRWEIVFQSIESINKRLDDIEAKIKDGTI